MNYDIITYGAGETLEATFNALAALINGQNGSIFNTLVRLGSFLGVLWGMMLVFYGEQMHFLTRWFLPYFVILMGFFTPTCTVHIIDPTSHHPPRTVQNIPFGIGMVAGTISKMGHEITQKIEAVFRLPDDLLYHKTGAVMASRLIADSKIAHITNPDIAETMREFVNQCVFFDALLGRKYTLDDLKNSDDIWDLVKRNASPARSFMYKEPKQKPEILTCQAGVQKLEGLLNVEVKNTFKTCEGRVFGNTQASGNLVKQYLPVSINYMTNMSKTAEDYMRQQMMIYGVIDAQESRSVALGNAPDFAKRRAYLQQRETQESLAWMASQKILAMKNVLEALIYAAFIFLLSLALLPMGWRFIGTWVSLVLWIQLWPPLYAILNFMMNMAAQSQSQGIIQSKGITIANSVGFTNLHADMAAQAGFLTISVGALAYALVKGGAASFVHLAGHLAGPGTSAASQAAGDMISGNYSFGNVTQGTVQAHNTTMGQHMLSPSYSSGAFSQNDGVIARITGSDGGHIVNVSNSNLRSSINLSESLSHSYAESATQAATASQSETVAFAQSQAQAYRNVIDLASHQSKSQSSGEGHVTSMSASDSRAFETAANLTDRFAKDHSISSKEASQVMAQAMASIDAGINLGVLGGRVGGSIAGNISSDTVDSNTLSQAIDYVKTSGLKDSLTQAIQATQEGRTSTSDETSQRYMQGINSSLESAQTHRHEATSQLQKSQSYSEMASFTKQNSGSINANMTQDYMKWLPQQSLPNSNGPMGQRAAEHIVAFDTESNLGYQKQFLEKTFNKMPSFMDGASVKSFVDVETSHRGSSANIPAISGSIGVNDSVASQATQAGFGDGFSISNTSKEQALDKITATQGGIEQHQSNVLDIGQSRQNLAEEVQFDGKHPSVGDDSRMTVDDLFSPKNQMDDQMKARLYDLEEKIDSQKDKNNKTDGKN